MAGIQQLPERGQLQRAKVKWFSTFHGNSHHLFIFKSRIMLSVVSVFGLRRSCFKQNKIQTLFIKTYTKFVCLVAEHHFVRRRLNNGETVPR